MASIQKRGKTYQYTVSRMENGKSRPIRKGGFRTKKEARMAATEIELQLGKGIIPYLRPVPIDEYFKKWVRLYKSHLSVTTQKHYEHTYKVIKAYFGRKALQEITRHEYQLFLNEYCINKSKETVEKLNIHIRACAKDAVEENIIQSDFTRKAVLPWTKPSKRTSEKHLSFKESEILLKEVCNRLDNNDNNLGLSLILLALTSGMRFAEMLGLTWNDFDFVSNTLKITKTWGYMQRNPTGFGPTKNQQSNRLLKMDDLTMNYFKKLYLSSPINPHNLIFFNPRSKYEIISNTYVNKILKNLLYDLELKLISVHGLRHTHASVLLYKKVSIQYVSERLGHSNIETTLSKYAHLVKELYEEDEQRTINIFNDIHDCFLH